MHLPKDCYKVLKHIYELNSKNENPYSALELAMSFPENEQGKIALLLDEILIELKKFEYITYTAADDTFYHIKITYKGIDYVENSFTEWLKSNSIAIIALAVSIIALFK